MQRIIGIDFGTSTTYMNIKRYNGAQPDGDKFSYIPVMFNYGESSGYVATIVRENADGSFDFGEKAAEPLEGSKIHTEIKMRLESSDEQERAEARRITREFFKFLHAQYAQQTANLGGAGDQEETVVSYPVKWKKETAQFMLDAARDAGFQNVRGMDEAEAAVATVLCQNSGGTGLIYADKPGYLMLIDMGAGTTDLVVCRYQASANGEIAIELVTSWPHSADEPTFGGREIDKVLEQYVEDHLTKSLLPALAPQASVIATAPGAAKQWKERNVSVTLAADKQVNTCSYIGTYKTMGMLTGDFPAFGRREFESFAESGLRDYARLISGCLEKTAEVDENFSALDLVILTGGHSAWYFAKEILTGAMEGWLDHPMLAAVRENPCRVVSLPNPQTTVSLGLVYSKLPFKLAKKPEQIQQQRAEQEVSVQPSAEDVMPAETEFNLEAFFLQEVRSFFAERICDLRAVNFAISRLNIPSGEELFWAEGIVKGAADPGTYAVTECGVYLQGAFGGKHCLSWVEFVSAEWAGRAFAAPSWQNGDNWDASVPLVVKQEKGPLKELHTHLRGFHGTLTAQATTQTTTEYTWNPQLVPVIKHFIQESPAFARQNELRDHFLVRNMSNAFQLGTTEEIFYAKHWGNVAAYRKPWGMLITSAGIHVNSGTVRFMTWWEFLNSHFEYRDDSQQEENRVIVSGKGVKVSFQGEQADSIGELHTLLRERAANLQSAAAPKAVLAKSQSAQTSRPVQNESLDAAMKRFNGQVKDAKQQQKAPVTPAQPKRTATQTSNRTYKWDARLLQFVKKFIWEESALCNTNVLNHHEGYDIVDQMQRNFGLSKFDTVYYAKPSGLFSRKKYQSGVIISSSGLWYREGVFKINWAEHLEWEMFLNGIVHAATKDCHFETIDYGNMHFTCPRWAFGETGAMSRLQKLLREKSVALEEGRPI